METQAILVTGGAGFIGTNLVEELRKRGHFVFVADLCHTRLPEYRRTDVRSYRQVEKLFENATFDYVYHLAAEYGRWNGEDYYENLWATNVVGTKHILRMQEKKGFRLIFFSSAEVYGDYAGVMNEDVMKTRPIQETYQMNDYAITKWAGELMCMNSSAMFGTETVRVRPVNCYGPHEHYQPYWGFIPKFIYHALLDQPYEVHMGPSLLEFPYDYFAGALTVVAHVLFIGKAEDCYLRAVHGAFLFVQSVSDQLENVLGHKVIDGPAGRDHLRVIAEFFSLMNEIVRVNR